VFKYFSNQNKILKHNADQELWYEDHPFDINKKAASRSAP
jgi:hypothetical protein